MKTRNATEEFLYNLSSHIQNRPKLNTVPITVVISDDFISIDPHIQVFPNRYHRKQSDAEEIVEHVLNRHMSDPSDQLVPGTYVYRRLWSSKVRRWRRSE